MKFVLTNNKNKYSEIFFLSDFDQSNIDKTFKKFALIKEPLEAKIFAINETINVHQLINFKKYYDKLNISSLCLYSNNRDTILTGKSLKIQSIFVGEKEA